jgi:kynurenine formamidase
MDFREVGKRLSNWGRWGKDDRIGTLNHITDARRAAAGKLIKTGKLFELGLAVHSQGIQRGGGVRSNPLHLMSLTPLDLRGRADGAIITDDYIIMPLQSVTQWDGLAHFGYDGFFYNGTPADTVTTLGGSAVLSIHQIAEKGIAGRGVLLDIARLKEVDRLESGYAITPDDLDAAEKAQGVKVGPGDILLIRTGWIRHFTVDKAIDKYWEGEPGIHLSCAEWLHKRDVAAICSDDWAVEVIEHGAPFGLPIHSVLIRDMGMTLGEIFVLEDLAADCAKDGVYEFFFASPPLKVISGVGSPITPLAIK